MSTVSLSLASSWRTTFTAATRSAARAREMVEHPPPAISATMSNRPRRLGREGVANGGAVVAVPAPPPLSPPSARAKTNAAAADASAAAAGAPATGETLLAVPGIEGRVYQLVIR